MAAGDVTIHGDSGRSIRNKRIVWGTVQLDGANATPIELNKFLSAVEGGQVSLQQTAAPGDDPSWLSCNPNGTALDVYAWKNTGGTDPTLVASTNATAVVAFVAFGKR